MADLTTNKLLPPTGLLWCNMQLWLQSFLMKKKYDYLSVGLNVFQTAGSKKHKVVVYLEGLYKEDKPSWGIVIRHNKTVAYAKLWQIRYKTGLNAHNTNTAGEI